MEPLSEPATEPDAPQPSKRGKQGRIWAAVFALITLGLVTRFAWEYHQNSLQRGDQIAREVSSLAEQAVKARDQADVAAARQSLAKALTLLREAPHFRSHPVYVSTLLDLGSLLLSSSKQGGADLDEGRQLLLEAWEIAKGLDARTRWRIARDLGLAAVLAGNMAEAEKWYSTATELLPEDTTAKERLNTLRSAKKWKQEQ